MSRSRPRRPVAVLLLGGLLLCVGAGTAAAQTPSAGELDAYAPCPLPGCVLNTPLANSGGHGTLVGGLWLVGATDLLRLQIAGSGEPLGNLVKHRLTGHLLLGGSLFQRVDVGVSLPVVAYQDGLDTRLVRQVLGRRELSSAGAADLRLTAKAALLSERGARPALALLLEVVAPTGAPRQLFGERGWVFAPSAVVSHHLGRTTVTGNLGARLRLAPQRFVGREIEHQLFYRGAVRYRWDRRIEPASWNLLAGVYGHTDAAAPFGLGDANGAAFANGMEALAGVERRWTFSAASVRLTLAAGTGILPGYGSARWRGLVGLELVNREPEADDDRDRIVNAVDLCPQEAEDVDEYADADGCPDLDNDGDGVEDVDDECPLEPEDRDGFEDSDGCAEISDQDSDSDGVSDQDDRCPEAAEDADLFADEDGCPDPDNDGDGLDDLHDVCPDLAEDQQTSRDKDGCPDSAPGRATLRVERGALQLEQPIAFETGKARLSPRAKPVLNQVAAAMRVNAAWRVRVVVTPVGPAPAQVGLAKRRALEVVRYLVARGIRRQRLEAVGLAEPGGTRATVQLLLIAR